MNLPQKHACFAFTIVNPLLIFLRRVKNWAEKEVVTVTHQIEAGRRFFSPAGFFSVPWRERKFTGRSRSALNSELRVLNTYLKRLILQRKGSHDTVSFWRRGHICLQHGCARVWRYFATHEDGQLNMTGAQHEVEYDVLMKQHRKWGK